MQDKNGWISDTTGFIGNGVEDCSQTTGDWVDKGTADLIGDGFGEG